MAIADDILYDAVNHRFYGSTALLAGSTFHDMSAFYALAIDIEDNSSSFANDEFFTLDANQLTYKTNGDLYIEQELVKHLKSASLDTSGYTDSIRLISFSGGTYSAALATTDIGKAVVGGTTGDSGILLDYDETAGDEKWWVRVDDATPTTGDIFDVAEEINITGGTAGTHTTAGASATGEELFACANSIGTVVNGNAYAYRGTQASLGAKIPSWWGVGNLNTNHVNVLFKVREAGALINGGDIIIFNRNWGDTFSHAAGNLSGGGVTSLALSTSADGNITLTEAQAEDLFDGTTASIAFNFGAAPYNADIDDDDSNETYEYQADNNGRSSSEVYQVGQWLTYKDSINAVDSIAGDAYISASSSYTEEPAAPLGSLPDGSTVIFAQGGYPINPADGNYQSKDTAGAKYSPPANILIGFSSGLIAGDFCYIAELTAPAGVVIKSKYTADGLNAIGDGTLTATASTAKDLAASSRIRVTDGNGVEFAYRYNLIDQESLARDRFTFTPVDVGTGVTTADVNGLVLTDTTGNFTNATNDPQAGDALRNITDGSWGIIAGFDGTTITLESPLQGGTDDQFDIADTYEINKQVVDHDGHGFYPTWVDGVASAAALTATVQFVADLDLVYKVRNSSPASVNKIKRFVAKTSATASGGTIPASRNPETLA